MTEARTVYEFVGGEHFFIELVDDFYDRVSADAILMALYPENLDEARRKTASFLAQYWGGPPNYSAERGHPRLRMRHARFAIGLVERDHWLNHMRDALHAMAKTHGLPVAIQQTMSDYFERGSTAMINHGNGRE